MNCINTCCRYFHKSISLRVSTSNNLIITASNSTNISSKEKFCFVLLQRPKTVITGSPIPVFININGQDVPVHNKFEEQMLSDELEKYYRKGIMKGYYVVDADDAGFVIFNEIPKCQCNM